jgi:Tfp pilus assembly protein PilV
MSRSHATGFSAIELLITIFVAAAFLAAGYQLYSAVLRYGADTRNQTTASNIAYDYLRRYSSQATNPCTVVTPVPAPTIPTPPAGGVALPSPSITASITCPYGTANGTSLVSVTVTYGYTSPQKQVQHAVYVTN